MNVASIASLTRDRAAAMGYQLRMLSDRKVYVFPPASDLGRELPLKRHGYESEEEAMTDLAVLWLRRFNREAGA